jgi:5-methylcytosine-specific restriction endonuclease McrA
MSNQEQLNDLSSQELFSTLNILRGDENKAVADIVLYLAEVDRRGIYREAGFSSLFTFCTERLGYSEAGAGRRVRAARCLAQSPEIYSQLKSGAITLCSLAEVAAVFTPANQELVLTAIQGASKREAQIIAQSFGAPKPAKRSTIRAKKVLITPPVEFGNAESTPPVTAPRYSFSFEVSQEVMDLYTEAHEIMGHLKPEEVFEKALRHFIAQKKQAPRVVAAKVIVKQDNPVPPKSRAVPLNIRRAVLQRDNYQCTYCAADGKRCSERVGLEIDHIKPYALGGSHQIENLRVVCKAHNTLFAEQVFGRDFIRGKQTQATHSAKQKDAP